MQPPVLIQVSEDEEAAMTKDWKEEQRDLDTMFEHQSKTKIASLPQIAMLKQLCGSHVVKLHPPSTHPLRTSD